MQQVEAVIRDALSSRLFLLEPGLRLINVEQFLPNPQGTRGFVDLFAQDESGKYVLIELKRSSAASREALHEVLKYLEAVRIGLSARDSEIRIFIVSTEWSELLVPFSSFVKRTACDVKGYQLKVDSDNIPIEAVSIDPIKLAGDRLFVSRHEINYYKSESSLKKGLKSYENSCASKEIKNYVMIVLESPPGHHQRSVEATRSYLRHLGESMGDSSNSWVVEGLEDHMPEFKYIMYFATLELPEAVCLAAIRGNLSGEELEEFEEYSSDLEDEERLDYFHDKLFEVGPEKIRDYFDVGYPSKFEEIILNQEGWKVARIQRYGTLKANEVLSDSAIISDLRGEDGKNHQNYRRKFTVSNISELVEVREGTKRCLRDNILWRNQILRILDDYLPSSPNSTAELSIYNPANFVFALYQFMVRSDGLRYVPVYFLRIDTNEEPAVLIFGAMMPNGNVPSFKGLIDGHFNGSGLELLSCLSWGGYLLNDVQVAHDVGMTYKTFKMDFKNEVKHFWELNEMGWKAHPPTDMFHGFKKFAENHSDFTADVLDFFSSHWDGVLWSWEEGVSDEYRT